MPSSIPRNAKWLLGQGVGTWFSIDATENLKDFRIRRFNPAGTIECDRLFEMEDIGVKFNINEPYEFEHISHCAKCRVKQNGIIFVFNYL